MKKTIVWIIVLILVVWGISALVKKNSAPALTGPIKIGFIGPLTGDAASYGEPIKNSVALAVNEINKAGGVGGQQIQMIYEDGKCTGTDAASAAQKLVNVDQVKYIIGGMCSGEVFSEIPITSKAQVFVISPSASAAKLSGISEYFVRNNPSDSLTGGALANYVVKSYKTAAIISEQTDFAQGIRDNFISEAEKGGLKIVDTEDFKTDTTDFRSLLSKIKTQNPDVLFINPQTPQNAIRIAQQARQLGLKSQFVAALFGSDPTLAAAGTATEGMVFADLAGLSTAKGQDFLSKYKATYNSDPNYPFYDGAAYDAVYLISQAVSSVGDDSTKVQKYIHSLANYTGVLGTYSFDKNGDIIGAGIVLEKIVGGKLVNVQ